METTGTFLWINVNLKESTVVRIKIRLRVLKEKQNWDKEQPFCDRMFKTTAIGSF